MPTLEEMITAIPDAHDRAIMRLYYIGNHKIREIAEAVDMTERNVNRHLKHGRRELTARFGIDFQLHQKSRS